MILNKIIVLIGYMGSGKTAVGKELSNLMNLPFIDLDTVIEKEENKSIDKIFSENGELYFRNLENKYLNNILRGSDIKIISLGGGTPCYFNAINILNNNKNIVTVFLRSSAEILAERLFKEIDKRPKIKFLTSKKNLVDYIRKHLFERNQFYNQSKYVIDTDDKSIISLAYEVKSILT